MYTKRVLYDASSITPNRGDQVEVLIQRHNSDPEWLRCVYMGSTHFEAYTTPYFKFITAGNQVRLINSNDIREWKFKIAQPDLSLPQLPLPETDEDDERF